MGNYEEYFVVYIQNGGSGMRATQNNSKWR